ncbi:neuferricin [Hydra vulgaris]|uniref:Neuferricin n=1 Tax=Hydra vulgaris TaxID=6087 RepID=A0ABM4CNZ3_HYDVU
MYTTEDGIQKPAVKKTYSCPTLSTFLFYCAIVVAALAIYLPIDMNYGFLHLIKQFDLSSPKNLSFHTYMFNKLGWVKLDNTKIWSKEELSKFRGDVGEDLYISILGKVFDVSKGYKHYGKGGAYNFFTGKDASRAFVTGDFSDSGLVENIDNLNPDDYLGLLNWLELYEKEYKYVGKLNGYFYDSEGMEKEGLKIFYDGVSKGKKNKLLDEEESKLFPSCNSKWTPETGTNVWCAKISGGISRDWIGFPRQFFKPGQTSYRCACVNEKHLNDPRFKVYTGCDPYATICKISD